MSERLYTVTEIFYSIQGEGIRTGEPSIFVRFAGCNMECEIVPGPRSPGGFKCDTDFSNGLKMKAEEIIERCRSLSSKCHWIVLTGGEPTLQLDDDLIMSLKANGYHLAIETNGTRDVPSGIDWITLSPKVRGHALRQRWAHEVKYVLADGQPLPEDVVQSCFKMLSPAFMESSIDMRAAQWCVQLAQENPEWRVSIQLHKLVGVK